ncbi:MAG: KpsF/GutQ family sugar-phosphate isomerase [Planctomycetota bacterium]
MPVDDRDPVTEADASLPDRGRSLNASVNIDAAEDERSFVIRALEAEANAVQRVADALDAGALSKALDLIDACRGHVIVSGMGKSGLIAQKISATFASIGVPSHFVHPAEAVHGDLGRIRREDVVLALSYSGNTDEVVVLASLVRADGVPVIGLSSNPASRLASASDVHLSIGDVVEACPLRLAPTASTTAMLALGDALGLAASRRRNFSADDYRKRHPGGMLGAGLRSVTEVLRFRVGENLPLIPEHVTVREALDLADTGRRPGAMIIVDEASGRMTGIFTDGDLRRLVMSGGGEQSGPSGTSAAAAAAEVEVGGPQPPVDPLAVPIASVMTRTPTVLNVDHLVRDTVELVRRQRQDEIPVVDHEGRPVGLIDVQDLISMKIVDG